MKGLVSFFFLNRANIIPNEIPVFNEGHPILLSKPKDELSILKYIDVLSTRYLHHPER